MNLTDKAAPKTSIFSPEYRAASIATFAAMALLAFEGTAIAAALPELAEQLGDVHLLPAVITSFLLASGIATVATGPLVDAVGVRKVFVSAATAMAVSGFVAGMATSMPMLIAFRIVQGATAGMLITTANAGVNVAFPKEMVARVFAGNSTVWGVMGATAPALASVMLTFLSWRWIFYINLPLGLLAAWLAFRSMPQAQPGAERHRLDVVGLGLVSAFSILLVLAISRLDLGSLVLAVIALACLGLFMVWARSRGDRAVMRLEDFAVQPYRGIGLSPTLLLAGAFCGHLYLPLYLSAGLGYGRAAAAWSVLWFSVGWTLGSNISSRALDRFDPPTVMTMGWGLATTGMVAAWATVASGTDARATFASLFVAGMGVGLSTNAALVAIRSVAELSEMGRKGGAHYFVRNQGFTMGSAAGGAVMLFVVSATVGAVEPVRELLRDAAAEDIDLPVGVTVADLVDSVARGYSYALALGSVLCLTALVPLLTLRRQWAG